MQELRGQMVSDQIKNECLDFVGKHNGILPALAIIRVGERPEDLAYERSVKKRFIDFGMEVKNYELKKDCTDAEFQEVFDFINDDPEINGILVMRPLPPQIDEKTMLKKLKPEKDMDGISPVNIAKVMLMEPDAIAPCTAQAVIELLKAYKIELAGKHAVVIGRSMVVGRPLAMLLMKENATVTVCHSKTENIKDITATGDIVITAVGRPRMVGSSYIKEDAVVVDVGINADADGKLCGDCDWDTIITRAAAATPVPGGLGTVTTAVLAKHLMEAAAKQMDFTHEDPEKDSYME